MISGHQMGATVSIGVATAIPPVEIDPLLARADAALYRAKHNGRNRVEFDRGRSRPGAWRLRQFPRLAKPVAALR